MYKLIDMYWIIEYFKVFFIEYTLLKEAEFFIWIFVKTFFQSAGASSDVGIFVLLFNTLTYVCLGIISM